MDPENASTLSAAGGKWKYKSNNMTQNPEE